MRASVTEHALGALIHQVLMAYDGRGLPVEQTDAEGTLVYDHDIAGRLVGVDHPVGGAFADEAYAYDEADRRVSGGAVHDDGDRLVQDASYDYAYDDEGRRISRTHRVSGAVTTYGYDAMDHLTSLSEGGVTWGFQYDARDLRVRVWNDAGYDERFVYDLRGTVRAVTDAAGTRTATYTSGFGFGEVLARVAGGGPEFAVLDRLGSTVAWVDGSGVVVEQVLRDVYGVRAALPMAVVPFGYTGHAEDPTGLVWGRARCYAPTTGAWLGEDPVRTEARYAYSGARPAYARDAT